jgi:pyruvate dehydrogenase E2 component (dihydrolipoamide acetyltransferase)
MDVLMPQLGETVAEGKITKWFKSAGDEVKPGDNLFEIETDKVSMEVPSTTTGTLSEIRVAAGEVAPVGAIVAVIADGSGATNIATTIPLSPAKAAVQEQKAEQKPVGSRLRGNEWETQATPAASRPSLPLDPFFEVRTPARNFGAARIADGINVTPLARRLAAENGIDLLRLRGSGPHGRIVSRDVTEAPRAHATGPSLEGPSAAEIKALYAKEVYEEVPLDGMRKTIATRLIQAATVPQFHLSTDVNVDRLLALRQEVNASAPTDTEGGPAYKVSINDFIIRALALALQQVPEANVIWARDSILKLKTSDIGVAVALDRGLVTPVIRNASRKSLSAISNEVKSLAIRAREKKLVPSDYQGGSSAISNLGMYGVKQFTAIINPPQATIFAIGAARRQPIESGELGVTFATIVDVTISCDHRAIDGALGAELLCHLQRLLQDPLTVLV